MSDYFTNYSPVITYVIVYDFYIGGCSQQRPANLKTFKSIEEADKYRWATSYCSPPICLEFRMVFERLSNGGWNEKKYIYKKDKSKELENFNYTKRDYSKETMDKVDSILKQHDKWRSKNNGMETS